MHTGVSKRARGGTSDPGLEPEIALEADDKYERRTDAFFRALKPRVRPYKESAGRGLYMLVMPNGSKYWRMKYRISGVEQSPYAIGVYGDVSLSEARSERNKARAWLRQGLDPRIQRGVERSKNRQDQSLTFKAMAEDWFKEVSPKWSHEHRTAQRSRLDKEILPKIGALPMKKLAEEPMHLLELLQGIHRRGAEGVVPKVRIILDHVFLHAVVPAGLASNPVPLLRGRFPRTKPVVHRQRIPLAEMGKLFETIAKVPMEEVTRIAMYFLILTVARTDEVRFATWAEIEKAPDGKSWWRIPAERMKGERVQRRREHIVPLSRQAMKILERAKALRTSSDKDALIFPGFTRHGALSENAFLAVLARAGYFGRQTGHGFRGSFKTWTDEHQKDSAIAELCLAHAKGGIEGVYSDAVNIRERRTLLQEWADQCTKWGMKA